MSRTTAEERKEWLEYRRREEMQSNTDIGNALIFRLLDDRADLEAENAHLKARLEEAEELLVASKYVRCADHREYVEDVEAYEQKYGLLTGEGQEEL